MEAFFETITSKTHIKKLLYEFVEIEWDTYIKIGNYCPSFSNGILHGAVTTDRQSEFAIANPDTGKVLLNFNLKDVKAIATWVDEDGELAPMDSNDAPYILEYIHLK